MKKLKIYMTLIALFTVGTSAMAVEMSTRAILGSGAGGKPACSLARKALQEKDKDGKDRKDKDGKQIVGVR